MKQILLTEKDFLSEILKALKSNNKGTWLAAFTSLVALIVALVALLK